MFGEVGFDSEFRWRSVECGVSETQHALQRTVRELAVVSKAASFLFL